MRLSDYSAGKVPTFVFLLPFLLLSCGNEEQPSRNKTVVRKDSISSPARLQPVYPNFLLQPYNGLDDDLVQYVYQKLQLVHDSIKLLPPAPLPQRAYYSPRSRYRADTLIMLQSEMAKPGQVIVGLTHKDISTDKGEYPDWGVMGLGYQPGEACVASTFRLSKNNLKEQFFKVVIHEMGHTMGLPHCPDQSCYMTDAEGKNKTDSEIGFCTSCKKVMASKGFHGL
jgi:archaemetzincin